MNIILSTKIHVLCVSFKLYLLRYLSLGSWLCNTRNNCTFRWLQHNMIVTKKIFRTKKKYILDITLYDDLENINLILRLEYYIFIWFWFFVCLMLYRAQIEDILHEQLLWVFWIHLSNPRFPNIHKIKKLFKLLMNINFKSPLCDSRDSFHGYVDWMFVCFKVVCPSYTLCRPLHSADHRSGRPWRYYICGNILVSIKKSQ